MCLVASWCSRRNHAANFRCQETRAGAALVLHCVEASIDLHTLLATQTSPSNLVYALDTPSISQLSQAHSTLAHRCELVHAFQHVACALCSIFMAQAVLRKDLKHPVGLVSMIPCRSHHPRLTNATHHSDDTRRLFEDK